MKLQTSRERYRTRINVNPRTTGAGLVIMQGTNRLLLSPEEWAELRATADAILAAGKPA